MKRASLHKGLLCLQKLENYPLGVWSVDLGSELAGSFVRQWSSWTLDFLSTKQQAVIPQEYMIKKNIFSSNKMLFSKWLYFLPVQAQGMYLLLGSLLLPLGVWHNIVGPIKCQQLLMDISCVWCSCTFLFQDMLEDSATQSESLWTLQLQPVVFSNPMYFKFAKFLQLQWPKQWTKCTTCRLCVW